MAGDAVLILADDLIWASRLADLVNRLGRRVVPARDLAAFERALPESAEVVVDLTGRAYDGVAAVGVAARAGHRVLCVGQHDDEALRERARAAGAERVLAYRAVFEGGPEGIGRWLSRHAPPVGAAAAETGTARESAERRKSPGASGSAPSDEPEIPARSNR